MKSHIRVFTMFISLAVAASIVIWGVSQKVQADAPPQRNPENPEAERVAIADYLPGDTLGFISVYDAPLAQIILETGMADAIASDYTEPIEKRVKALQEYAGSVRSLHLAMKEFRPGLEPAPFLLIAETGLPDAVATLPEIIRDDLIPDGTAHEIEIFRVRMDELSEADPPAKPSFIRKACSSSPAMMDYSGSETTGAFLRNRSR